MKKVLSVAMASAMVLGMGANAFAIQYSTGSNEEAAWPSDFKFAGSLFVTDKDGNIVESTLTDLNGKTRVDFQPGDTIWMPLYADNQRVYEVTGTGNSAPAVSAKTEYITPAQANAADGSIEAFHYEDTQNKVLYWYDSNSNATAPTAKEGWRVARISNVKFVERSGSSYKTVSNIDDHFTTGTVWTETTRSDVTSNASLSVETQDGAAFGTSNGAKTIKVSLGGVTIENVEGTLSNSGQELAFSLTADQVAELGLAVKTADDSTNRYSDLQTVAVSVSGVTVTTPVSTTNTTATLSSTKVATMKHEVASSQSVLNNDIYVKVELPALSAVSTDLGTTVGANEDNNDAAPVYADDYHYTGNIDKNWSINLIEEDNGVADLIEKAELYKADEVDYLSYNKYTEEIVPNGVYLKVTLKKTWKLADDANLKYYVYVADNKSGKETNKVWVSGNYAASYQYVNFTWTNDASKAGLWKVKDGENGVAVFDFADKAFFQVKMYSKESMYLDLSTAYDKAIAGDFSEADAFFSFDNENANFSRTGTLILVSDDASLVPYQVTKDGYTKVDAEYVKDFAIAHTNEKVNGFVFETKELGNYVLATEEVAEEEDNNTSDNTQEVVVPDTDNNETNNNSKPNPITGAEDFVGLAVSLAVVSVAAAGALALKK